MAVEDRVAIDDEVAQGLALLREAASTEWWVTQERIDLWGAAMTFTGVFDPELGIDRCDADDLKFGQQCELIDVGAWTSAMTYECWSMLAQYKSALAKSDVDFDSIPVPSKSDGDGRRDACQIERAIEETGWGWKELLLEDRPINEIRVLLARIMGSGVASGMRFEVLERDGFVCKRCGASPRQPEVQLVVDKIQPGEMELENVQTICTHCVQRAGPQLWDYY